MLDTTRSVTINSPAMPLALSLPARRARRSPGAAFTLLEILVVLAILGLLIGVLLTNVGGNLSRGQEDAARIFVNTTMKAPLTAYRIDFGDYPSTAEGLQALIEPPPGKEGRWRGYVEGSRLPLDPVGRTLRSIVTPVPAIPRGYDLFSKGPDRTADTADDIGNW
jgi:general secretion pathway protein G